MDEVLEEFKKSQVEFILFCFWNKIKSNHFLIFFKKNSIRQESG